VSPPVVGVYETVVYGRDMEALAAFYREVLGLRLVEPVDELGAAFRIADDAMLLLFDPARASLPGRPVPSHGTTGEGHIAFAVAAESLDEWRAALAAAGVSIEQEVEWGRGGHSIYVRDPAGNSVELVTGDLWPP
jgi:catechol 2,3-dioxygenase-like lactoylglutathione lyase family enzyme